jgi:hypothetical protein
MDGKDEADLMKLADNCAGQLQKKAIWWAGVGIASLVVPALAMTGWAMWGDYSAQSVYSNAELVKRETGDLAEEGVPWASNLINEMNILQDYAVDFRDTANRLMSGIGGKVSYDGAVRAAARHQTSLQKMVRYENVLRQELQNIDVWVGRTTIKPEEKDVSRDPTQKLMEVWRSIVPSDMEEVKKALEGLRRVINQTLETNARMRQESRRYTKPLQEAAEKYEGAPETQEGLPKGITPLKPIVDPGVARPSSVPGADEPAGLKSWTE